MVKKSFLLFAWEVLFSLIDKLMTFVAVESDHGCLQLVFQKVFSTNFLPFLCMFMANGLQKAFMSVLTASAWARVICLASHVALPSNVLLRWYCIFKFGSCLFAGYSCRSHINRTRPFQVIVALEAIRLSQDWLTNVVVGFQVILCWEPDRFIVARVVDLFMLYYVKQWLWVLFDIWYCYVLVRLIIILALFVAMDFFIARFSLKYCIWKLHAFSLLLGHLKGVCMNLLPTFDSSKSVLFNTGITDQCFLGVSNGCTIFLYIYQSRACSS